MTQNQLPPDLKKVVCVIGTAVGGFDIAAKSFSVGTHNTASWKCGITGRRYYCHLSQITMVVTEEEKE